MKINKYIKLFFLVMCFLPAISLAQFNTLTPSSPQKEGLSNYFEKEKEANKEQFKADAERKNEKKKMKKSSKTDLKNELDSLKTMLLQYSLNKNKQNSIDYRKIEDSIISIMHQKQNFQNINYKKLDFIEDHSEIASGKIFMPLNRRFNITSGFGERIHPIFGSLKMHNGIDLDASYENVYAVMDGIVTESGWDLKGGGYYMKINHFGRFETSYLHLSYPYYQQGETVKAGYIIAKSGNTGNSTGAHLHFAVKEYGSFINPVKFLNDLVKVNNLIALTYEK
jgi:murein DD-endopeptidase MepM/ murein hydrolase activator NlpD